MNHSSLFGLAFTLVFALFCVPCSAGAASVVQSLIGKKFVSHFSKSIPQQIEGCVLEDDVQPVFLNRKATNLMVSGARCGGSRVYVLSVDRDAKCSKGQDCVTEIVDILAIGDFKRREQLSHVFNDHFCFPPKKLPSMNVAVARFRLGANKQKRWGYRSGLVAAWGVDVKEKKFVAMDVRRIECEAVQYD